VQEVLPNCILLAAFDPGLIKLVVLVIIFIFAGIAKLLAKIQRIPPPGQRPLSPRPAPPDVADEIEEFMRRAAQRQPAKGTRPLGSPPSPPRAEPVRAEVIAEVAAPKPVGGQVSEHVQKYLDEQEFSRREVELGKQVAQADQQIDQHLQQVFDHRVSKLAATPGEAAAPPVAYEPPDLVGAATDVPASFATGLLDLIGNPDSLRQAIVLNEILRRPEDRWG
jgi:hypothetical protein